VRKILASDAELEHRLDELLAERREALDEQAARLEQAVQDLERREQLLRDSRASIERLLRLGTSDLDSREDELVQLMRDVTAREERVRADEAELARRREELGAVELKRAALDRRERAVAQREELASRLTVDVRDVPSPLLAFVPGTGYRLHELEEEALRAGEPLTLDDQEYLVARLGPSPLPNDRRRCAYLVRGPRRARPSDGSS
jgi:DNA repair exonuclease SbcCD ATPase subunit